MTRRDYFKRKGRFAILRRAKKAAEQKPLTAEQQQVKTYIGVRRLVTACSKCERRSLHGRRPLAWYGAGATSKVNEQRLIRTGDVALTTDYLNSHVPLCRSCVRRIRYGE